MSDPDGYASVFFVVCLALMTWMAMVSIKKQPERKIFYAVASVLICLIFAGFGNQFLVPKIYEYKADRLFDKQLRSMPVLETLRRHDPEAYTQLFETFRNNFALLRDPDKCFSTIFSVLLKQVHEKLPYSSEQAISAYYAMTVDVFARVPAGREQACVNLLFSQEYLKNGINIILPLAEREKYLKMTELVIKSYDRARYQQLNNQQASEIIMLTLVQLHEKYGMGTKVLLDHAAAAADPGLTCRVARDFFQHLLSLEPSQREVALRVLTQAQEENESENP